MCIFTTFCISFGHTLLKKDDFVLGAFRSQVSVPITELNLVTKLFAGHFQFIGEGNETIFIFVHTGISQKYDSAEIFI
jgi:hypothetical protein